MQLSVMMPETGFVAAKLKASRLAANLSTQAVSALITKRFAGLKLSHASIANYEKGAGTPGVDVLGALALIYDRPLSWFFEPGVPLVGIRYRHLSSKSSIKERHAFECQSQFWLESYIRFERRLESPLRAKLKARIPPDATASDAAEIVRATLRLRNDEPIPSVIDVLEGFGIRVMEMPTDLAIDGFAARFGEEHVVILKPTSANDRCRLNAAHELGHVLFGDCDAGGETTRAMDDRAFEFASHLLIPPKQLVAAFEGRSAVRLVQFKERFGVSMAAMIYRAEKLSIIDAGTTKRLWIQFSRRGWRANEPGMVRADRAIRFEMLIDQAVSARKFTWADVAQITGLRVEELKRRRDLAMGIMEPEEPYEEGGDVISMSGA